MSRKLRPLTVCGIATANNPKPADKEFMSQLSRLFPVKMLKIWLPLVFITAVISHFPAQLVWRYTDLADQMPAGVMVRNVGGTVWNGRAVIGWRQGVNLLEFRQEWQLGLGALWRSGSLLVLRITHPGSELRVQVSPDFALNRFSGSLSGHVDPLLLNPFLKSNNGWISGDIRINELFWQIENGRPKSIEGAIIWQGGETYFVRPDQASPAQKIRYPQMAVRVMTLAENGSISASLSSLDNAGVLGDLIVGQDGWVTATLYGRLKQAVPELPAPRKGADQVLFRYKEKVF